MPLLVLHSGRSPLPALYEGVTRREVSARIEGMVHGLALLLLLGAIVALSISELRPR